jgi:hypothetical protein
MLTGRRRNRAPRSLFARESTAERAAPSTCFKRIVDARRNSAHWRNRGTGLTVAFNWPTVYFANAFSPIKLSSGEDFGD